MPKLLIYLLAGVLLAPLIALVADARAAAPATHPSGEQAAEQPADPDAPPAPFALELTVEADVIEVGDRPKFNARLRNISDQPIVLVGALDGSESSMRYPRMPVSIKIDPQPADAPVGFARCGNTNNLRVEDFVEVKPGESFDPFDSSKGFFGNFYLQRDLQNEGEYTFQLTYDATSEDIGEWRGFMAPDEPGDEMQKLFERVPKFKVQSEVVKIRVVEKGTLPDLQ